MSGVGGRPSAADWGARPALSLTAGVLLTVACGAAPNSSPTPTATLPAGGPRVVLPSGAVYSIEVARTPEEEAQGLMYRESLPDRTGMVFLFADKGVHHFWMKNTMIPLDIIWMDDQGRVIFISANTPPCRSDPCPSYGPDTPTSAVLEVAGGTAAKEKVAKGASIRFIEVR